MKLHMQNEFNHGISLIKAHFSEKWTLNKIQSGVGQSIGVIIYELIELETEQVQVLQLIF